MNTFGKIFTLTTFGESHGEAIGGGDRRYAVRNRGRHGLHPT